MTENSKRCKKCGKFCQLPDHTNLCIDCYFNPKTTIKEKYKDDFIKIIGMKTLEAQETKG